MAALFCASLRRSAMRRRSRVMRTRSSRAPGSRGGRGAAGGGAGAGFAVAAGAAAAAPRSICVSTSPLVRRPSLPLAAILLGSSLFSSTILRTAGPERSSTATLPLAEAEAEAEAEAVAETAGALVSLCDTAAGCVLPGAAAFAAPSPMRPSTAPTATLLPSGTAISDSVPAAGALTSSVTLSVSSSTSGSSIAIVSPIFFSHRATVASVTDSPSVGTLMSVAMDVSASVVQVIERASSTSLACSALCRFKSPVAVARPLGLAVEADEHLLDAPLDEAPGAHVLRLLLAPDDIGEAIFADGIGQRLRREGMQLLEPDDGHIPDLALAPRRPKVVIDLAGAQHNAVHLVVGDELIGLVDGAAEIGARPHLAKLRRRLGTAQQRFRRHDHQRLAEIAPYLPAQGVEIIGRGGEIADLEVV